MKGVGDVPILDADGVPERADEEEPGAGRGEVVRYRERAKNAYMTKMTWVIQKNS